MIRAVRTGLIGLAGGHVGFGAVTLSTAVDIATFTIGAAIGIVGGLIALIGFSR